ncbi:putative protein without homology [Propionibacterium freudenreichii subsp. shermanii]|nr:putative protein without homology [Propionibacterium freudenreichii subsp. shermanii]
MPVTDCRAMRCRACHAGHGTTNSATGSSWAAIRPSGVGDPRCPGAAPQWQGSEALTSRCVGACLRATLPTM